MKTVTKGTLLAIGLVWLFHFSAIIGISMGHKTWFITKTPLNLLACTILFGIIFSLNSRVKWFVFLTFFVIGMAVEWLGVNYSLLFGTYDYGQNLGLKFDGVPVFIGVNWALLAFITGQISSRFLKSSMPKALLGASLMVVLDLFMEQVAPSFDFWSFGNHVPLENYVTWFIVAFIMQCIFQLKKISGNYPICLHLFVAQLVFFGYFTLNPM